MSPDESRLAYGEKAETPGATEGWQVVVVRIADGSRVESWPVQPRHIIRRCSDGRTMVSRGNSRFNVWEQQLAGGASKQ